MRFNADEYAEDFDQDAIEAGLTLCGRSGAREVEFGYLDDDVPIADARWWAKAQYDGARLQVENLPGPAEAIEALARKILEGGECTHCQETVRLEGEADGPGCRWSRLGRRWIRGCEPLHQPRTVAQQRWVAEQTVAHGRVRVVG